jgi:hypothetical protein
MRLERQPAPELLKSQPKQQDTVAKKLKLSKVNKARHDWDAMGKANARTAQDGVNRGRKGLKESG